MLSSLPTISKILPLPKFPNSGNVSRKHFNLSKYHPVTMDVDHPLIFYRSTALFVRDIAPCVRVTNTGTRKIVFSNAKEMFDIFIYFYFTF